MARKSRRKSLLKKRRTRRKRVYKKRGKSVKNRRRKTKRVVRRRRKRVQKGGYGKCQNPFQGKYVPYEPLGDMRRGILTRQMAAQRGGGSIWRRLGLTFPVDAYHDAKDFLTNTKNRYVGDRQDSTSNVMDQPIANRTLLPAAPTDYSKSFINADSVVAGKIKTMTA